MSAFSTENDKPDKNESSHQGSLGNVGDSTYCSVRKLSKKQLLQAGSSFGLQAEDSSEPVSKEPQKTDKSGGLKPPPIKPKPFSKQSYSSSPVQASGKASSAKERKSNVDRIPMSNKKGQQKRKVEVPLSMNPFKATAYENVAFEATETDPTDSRSHLEKKEKTERSIQRNKDGLIYLSLEFEKTKSDKPPPPKREKTEYVSIDHQKTASLQQDDISNG